jgi:hypothetical protein
MKIFCKHVWVTTDDGLHISEFGSAHNPLYDAMACAMAYQLLFANPNEEVSKWK